MFLQARRFRGFLRRHVAPCALAAGLAAVGALGSSALERIEAAPGDPGPREQALVELGRRLFFDPVVSRSGARSCASCHDPEHGFSDPARSSEDDVGLTVRHTQTLLDSHLNPSAHWDGEFTSIEALVTARVGLTASERGYGSNNSSPLTPGHSTLPFPEESLLGQDELGRVITRARGAGHDDPTVHTPLAARVLTNADLDRLPRAQDVLEEGARYEEAFKAAFSDTSVTTARIARAIAAYCRSLKSTPAPVDRYLAGDHQALTPAAQRGLALFRGQAGCASCHTVNRRHPVFTDFSFHNTGVAWRGFQERRLSAPEEQGRAHMDPGRLRISTVLSDMRSFKTPTLRDLTRRGPYMHDGSLATLADVVRFYAAGAGRDPEQDPRLAGIQLGEAQQADLVAFLEHLTGYERPGLAQAGYRVRAGEMRLRLVDARLKPMAQVSVRLVAAGDRVPGPFDRGGSELVRVTDEQGWLTVPAPPTTHWQVELGEGLTLLNGALVPDTSASATLVVPVSERRTLTVIWPVGVEPPPELVVEHEGTLVLPGHLPPRSRFALSAQVAGAEQVVARYEGWQRTDVPTAARLRLPGGDRKASIDVASPDSMRVDAR